MQLSAPLVVHQFDELDSTQSEAKRRIDAIEFAPCWILASVQLAGRGRSGKTWISSKGNYLASLVLPWKDVSTSPKMSFVTGLALFDSFEELGLKGLALKWPNDVLVDGHKIAGILLECHKQHLIIGVGVNIAEPPMSASLDSRALPPIALSQLTDCKLDRFHSLFEGKLITRITQYHSFGFDVIKQAVASRLWARAEMVYENGSSSDIVRVLGIDDDGSLIIDGSKGRQKVMAGDFYPAKEGRDASGN